MNSYYIDGRNGAFGLTTTRVITTPNSLPYGLLQSLKDTLFILDDTFNDKLILLLKTAIYEFEKLTNKSLLPQTITLNYEYFKGKNKMPFSPHTSISAITNFTISGGDVKYVDGGIGDPLTINMIAGYSALPDDIALLLVQMAQVWFNQESLTGVLPVHLYNRIKQHLIEIE
jgi:hypothetical protein